MNTAGRIDPLVLKKRVLQRIAAMPPLPTDILELFHILCTQRACDARLAEILENDAAFAEQLIRVAGSPLHPRVQRVQRMSEAATVLGMQRINALILTGGLADYVGREFKAYGRRAGGMWRQSLCVAATARGIATSLGFSAETIESIFAAAILHDIGKAVIDACVEDLGVVLPNHAIPSSAPGLIAVEDRILQTNHAEVGKILAEHWRLQPLVREAIRHHHQPSSAGSFRSEIAVIHLADHVVAVVQNGCDPHAANETPIDPEAIAAIEVTPDFLAVCQSQAYVEVAATELTLDALGGNA